jgi:hypothetical protein
VQPWGKHHAQVLASVSKQASARYDLFRERAEGASPGDYKNIFEKAITRSVYRLWKVGVAYTNVRQQQTHPRSAEYEPRAKANSYQLMEVTNGGCKPERVIFCKKASEPAFKD